MRFPKTVLLLALFLLVGVICLFIQRGGVVHGTSSNVTLEELIWQSKRYECVATVFDDEVVAEYHFENRSDKSIRFDKIRPSCNCLEVTCDDREIAPGEKGVVNVTFEFRQRYGRKVNRVRIVKSDKTVDTLTLIVDIPQVFEMTPDKLRWSVGERMMPKAMRLKNISGKPVKLLNAISDHKKFTSELKTIESGQEYEVTVTPNNTSVRAYALVWCKTDLKNPETGTSKSIDLRAYIQE